MFPDLRNIPASQLAYRTGSGRFSPISSRSASTLAGVASVPSFEVAGSPGITAKARNTRKDTTRRVAAMDISFLIIYFTSHSLSPAKPESCVNLPQYRAWKYPAHTAGKIHTLRIFYSGPPDKADPGYIHWRHAPPKEFHIP